MWGKKRPLTFECFVHLLFQIYTAGRVWFKLIESNTEAYYCYQLAEIIFILMVLHLFYYHHFVFVFNVIFSEENYAVMSVLSHCDILNFIHS